MCKPCFLSITGGEIDMKKIIFTLFIALAMVPIAKAAAHGSLEQQRVNRLNAEVLQNNGAAVEQLLAAGLNPNIPNKNGDTALMLAADKGFDRMVALLLAYGADPNIANTSSFTPLLLAASKGHENVVKVLLDAGADQHIPNINGFTQLDIATFGKHRGIVELLMRYEMNR
jgi:ankyrin repeat protein